MTPDDVPLPGFEDFARESPPVKPIAPGFSVEIVRSRRRRRSVSAQLVGGVLQVTAPAWMSTEEAQRSAHELAERFRRRFRSDAVDLDARALMLSRRYRLPAPQSIRWSTNMARRWGSCTNGDGSIRISDAVAAFPAWVLDYVIVHELAHLEVADHSREFWALVARYPKAERARGYLVAKACEEPAQSPHGRPGRRPSRSRQR